VPFVEVWRRRPGVLVLATLGFVLAIMLFYVITTFCLTYATGTLHIDKTTMLMEAIVATSTLEFGALSDRVGGRAVCIAAAVLSAVWAFPLFWMMQTHLIGVAMVIGLLCFGLTYGPLGAWCPELFRVRYRYTGASFVYGVARIVGGGISALVATDILAATHATTGISWYIIGIAVFSLVCLPFLAETRTADYSDGLLTREH
jgi:nitrate/nitrite transporter NarK